MKEADELRGDVFEVSVDALWSGNTAPTGKHLMQLSGSTAGRICKTVAKIKRLRVFCIATCKMFYKISVICQWMFLVLVKCNFLCSSICWNTPHDTSVSFGLVSALVIREELWCDNFDSQDDDDWAGRLVLHQVTCSKVKQQTCSRARCLT